VWLIKPVAGEIYTLKVSIQTTQCSKKTAAYSVKLPMTDTTTIEITQAQKAQLDELKAHSRESYKSVLEKLVESWQGEKELQRKQTIDVEDARILSQHLEKAIAPYFEEMEAQLPSKMADELEGRLRK
jgi:putative alpha-1,2-mannosidase